LIGEHSYGRRQARARGYLPPPPENAQATFASCSFHPDSLLDLREPVATRRRGEAGKVYRGGEKE